MNKRVVRGLTASAAIAGAVVVGASTAAAPANAGPLPGAVKTKNLGEGSITIRLFDESARISRAVTNIPTSREVMVSGKVRVTTSGGVKGGSINAGYIVGCQLNFGAGVGAHGQIDGGPEKDGGYSFALNRDKSGGNGQIELSPGKAAFVPVVNTVIGDDTVNSFTFSNAQGGVAYSGERFGVDGCAGFAQAQARVTVKVSTDTFKGNVTLYGKPFSIG